MNYCKAVVENRGVARKIIKEGGQKFVKKYRKNKQNLAGRNYNLASKTTTHLITFRLV